MIKDIEEVKNLSGESNHLQLFRIDFNGLRLYVNPDPFAYYSGLTGALSAATFKGDPAERRLKSWRESMIDSYGKDNAYNYVNATAEFGTLLHTALVTIKETGKIVWSEERDRAEAVFNDLYLTNQQIPNVSVITKMVYEYQKHVASLLQFIYERVSGIDAIETPAIWKDLKIATPIDLVCTCRQTPKGKDVLTTINIKTSSQITPHHLDQAACELLMWKETYKSEVEHTGIMRTKDWTEGKTPTFDYKYMDIGEALERTDPIIKRLALCLDSEASYFPEPSYKAFTGETEAGQAPEIEIRTLEQEWAEYWKKRNS